MQVRTRRLVGEEAARCVQLPPLRQAHTSTAGEKVAVAPRESVAANTRAGNWERERDVSQYFCR